MDAIEAITRRVSVPVLTGPDVTDDQIQLLLMAALRAPDHAWLRPSRYLLVRGDSLDALGEVFASTLEGEEATPEAFARMKAMPKRAPLVIVAVCRVVDHPKVPREEQLLSTGAGVQNILNAAHALGLGAIWRTGPLSYNPVVHAGLGLLANDVISGFIYLGTPAGKLKEPPLLDVGDFVSDWKC
jgi:nitroreductase